MTNLQAQHSDRKEQTGHVDKEPQSHMLQPQTLQTFRALSVMSLDLDVVPEDLGVDAHGDEVAEVAADVRVPRAVLGHLEGGRVAAGKVLALT